MNFRKIIALASGAFSSLLVSGKAFAEDLDLSLRTDVFPTGSQRNIGNLVSFFIKVLFAVGGILMLIYLIIGGIRYITSGGDKAQAQAARDMITNALIGIIIIASSYAIAMLLNSLFGINVFSANLSVPNS